MCVCVCVCPSHLAGRGVRGRLLQPCFMADINPGASGHQARLDCKRGGGKALSPSPLLRVSAAGTVPANWAAFESAGTVCFSKGSYTLAAGSLRPIGSTGA